MPHSYGVSLIGVRSPFLPRTTDNTSIPNEKMTSMRTGIYSLNCDSSMHANLSSLRQCARKRSCGTLEGEHVAAEVRRRIIDRFFCLFTSAATCGACGCTSTFDDAVKSQN